ncbi:hypothetical protein HPULCUR_009139 [Helicostylum pulchrum]|uniref:Anaphase-promoting complex subunit 5 n=1 Tax=Helicostylum pulchrum TaxID=562976 RepID=A0ABP9Y9L4_9FUNG
MGMFIRRCRVEYASMEFGRLADIREAFHQYIHGQSGDSQFLTQKQATWVSVYNVKDPVQYALLNIGILEYRFGHLYNALSALNDALSSARFNKDEYCLQEVQ